MMIDKAIEGLQQLKNEGKEEIFVTRGGFLYDFDFGMDDKATPVMSLLKHPAPIKETTL
jgi:hypothetical protein